MVQATPPQVNELELSVFGPGIGECLLVHLGAGSWMVVDSCLNAARDKPIALDYLDLLGVNVATEVKLIVVSHWHDDHIRGIARLFEAATSAKFACSAALRSKEFFALIAKGEEIKLVEETSGISEFAQVLEILSRRRSSGRYASGPDYWACDCIRLYSQETPSRAAVHSLSPSHQTITDSKAELGRLLPTLGKGIRRFPFVAPNDLSTVLVVETAGVNLLLGADLERGQDERRGWKAVVNSALRPPGKSAAYKVAHHGSSGADLHSVWESLVDNTPTAVLTPYARGSKPLPSEADVKRIKSKANRTYCTAWPPTVKPPRRRNADLTIARVALTRRATRQKPGHIRLRVALDGGGGDMRVELFDGAVEL
jgi:hypothetical protein